MKKLVFDDIFDEATGKSSSLPKEGEEGFHDITYLSKQAPNIIEWVTGIDYWNVPTTFNHYRQYQILRDLFNCRCEICNDPKEKDPWGKGREYLESEVLFTWSEEYSDFVCPKCKATQKEHLEDGIIKPYNELICIAGMRSGKSYTGAHIAGYIEHLLRVISMKGPAAVPRYFNLEKSEWLDCTFAASTTTQAEHTVFAKYRHMRDNSPWINKHVSYVLSQEKKQIASSKDAWSYKARTDAVEDGWLQVRFNRIASDASGAAGKTRVYACIDEWARLVDTDGTRSSKELYAVLNQSLKTVRGAVTHNEGLFRYFGLLAAVTSAWAHDDPAYELYNKAAAGELQKTYYWKGATWEFNPFLKKEDFADDFIKNRAQAERDFASTPPLSSSVLIENPELFWKSIDWDRKPKIRFSETTVHDVTGKFYNAVTVEHCEFDSSGQSYFAVADAGLNWDCFAFVIGHGEWRSLEEFNIDVGAFTPMDYGVKPVRSSIASMQAEKANELAKQGFVKLGGENSRTLENAGFVKLDEGAIPRYKMDDRVYCTVIDGLFRIIPSDTNEIWYNSILDVVSKLYNRINLVSIKADHWNSANLFQNIRSKYNIQADYYRIKPEDFLSFVSLSYEGRISMLPPALEDGLEIDDTGNLIMKTRQEEMKASSVALIELLKLNKSPDLRRFFNEKKGVVRGRDSDDLARCVIALNAIVQNSVVSIVQGRKAELLQRQIESFGRLGRVFTPTK